MVEALQKNGEPSKQVGFNVTFFTQFILGSRGMPRRYYNYVPEFQTLHQISTVGAAMLGLSTLFFIWNVIKTFRTAPKVTVDDPWGWGGSLEWATSCPPPRHNFTSIPRIRSERPAFDLHHPEAAALDAARRIGGDELPDLQAVFLIDTVVRGNQERDLIQGNVPK